MGAGKLGFLGRPGNEIRFLARGFHQDTFRTESFFRNFNPASMAENIFSFKHYRSVVVRKLQY
jgi:hypothetical protein